MTGRISRYVLPLCLLVACSESEAPASGSTSTASGERPFLSGSPASSAVGSGSAVAPRPGADESALLGDEAAWQQCDRRRQELRRHTAAPGVPAAEAERVQLVGRVRGATVLFKREPRRNDAAPEVVEALQALESSKKPLQAVRDMLHRFRRRPALLRAGLLPEGYLYVRGVEAALAVVQQVSLTRLFKAPEIHLLRNGLVHRLRRQRRGKRVQYIHVDGELANEVAEILFADRVGPDPAALRREPAAVDFSAARAAWGFERIRVEHLTAEALVAQVRYGPELWVPVLFDVSKPSARLSCHALTPQSLHRVEEARRTALQAQRVQAALRRAVRAQVGEQLPFDAPRGGGGDDKDKYPLRARWRDAYDKSHRTFRFDGKKYSVYDQLGRPLVPQVCIDFIYDTWERASGTWYRPMARDEPKGNLRPAPQRVMGGVDIDALGIKNRRRVSKFLQFAETHPEYFDVWRAPRADRIVYEKRALFFASLVEHVEQFRPGDVLVVRRPKFEGRALHHNLIVLETDLFVGIPTLLAGNAARPRIQTFEGIMQITPRRYLEYRIRPQAQWLDAAILQVSAPSSATP